MCQCVCFDCWWINCCGVLCGGLHQALCICSFWLLKPLEMERLDPECCHIGDWVGYGGNCFCYGSVCCAPKAIKDWSNNMSSGKI